MPRELDAFSRYLTLLTRWSRTYSLTSYRDPLQMIEKLLLDSLLFVHFIPYGAREVLDLGSGVGVPGIPIAIVKPELAVSLLESQRRKVSFLRNAVREIKLGNVHVVEGRAEEVVKTLPGLEGRFEVVVCRAVGPPGVVWEAARNFLKPGGSFVASGPPVPKAADEGRGGSWSVLTTPSGISRRFYVSTKPA